MRVFSASVINCFALALLESDLGIRFKVSFRPSLSLISTVYFGESITVPMPSLPVISVYKLKLFERKAVIGGLASLSNA